MEALYKPKSIIIPKSCEYCGNALSSMDKYCTVCGNPVKARTKYISDDVKMFVWRRDRGQIIMI